MPKRRDLVKMSEAEMWAFIETQKSIQVATINKDGSPHLVPLWFAMDDRAIVLETFTKSQKIKNLERDDRITVLFEDGDSYPELKGVTIYAHAQLIQDYDQVHELHMKVLLRNTPEIPENVLDEATRKMVPKKTIIRIEPEKVVSWDHSKLDGIY
jgi:PPOX class probable F420-dependent enzyme